MLEMLELLILLSLSEDTLTRLLLYDDNTLTDNANTLLLNSVIG